MKGELGGKILVNDKNSKNFELFPTGKDSTSSTFYVTSSGVTVTRLSSLGNILIHCDVLCLGVWLMCWSSGGYETACETIDQLKLLLPPQRDCWLITPWVILQRKNYKCPRRNPWPQDDPGAKIVNLGNSENTNVAPRAIAKWEVLQ